MTEQSGKDGLGNSGETYGLTRWNRLRARKDRASVRPQ
jgi:hypothetical protein